MRYLSVCSGIEAATCAWHPLGWKPVAFSEIEPFPSAVLAHHYPSVPNLGDMTRFQEWPDYADLDVLVGGTPCQSFSVAGLRAGMADPRGNLMLTFGAIARRYRPRWLVWENVPGVLSSGGGRDFGTFLGMLGELGYGFAYRVLDAQYFGLAQRRKRVFVVGHLGAWQPAAAVLFESASLRGNPAPRRESGERASPTLAARTRGGGGLGTDFDCDGGLVIGGGGGIAHALRADGFDASEDGTGRGTPLVPLSMPQVSPALKARDYKGPSSDGDGDGDGSPLICMAPAFSKRPGQQIANRQDGLAYAVTTGEPARVLAPAVIPYGLFQVTAPVNRQNRQNSDPCHTLARDNAAPAVIAFHARQDPDSGPVAHPLDTDGHSIGIAYALRSDAGREGVAKRPSPDAEGRLRLRDPGFNVEIERAPTLDAGAPHTVAVPIAGIAVDPYNGALSDQASTLGVNAGVSTGRNGVLAMNLRGRDGGAMPELDPDGLVNIRAASGGSSRTYVLPNMAVRRLTPRECERLQGFPDDYTLIPYRNKPASDGPRYKALGNSMAVPCMAWIGKRIAASLIARGE